MLREQHLGVFSQGCLLGEKAGQVTSGLGVSKREESTETKEWRGRSLLSKELPDYRQQIPHSIFCQQSRDLRQHGRVPKCLN